MVVDAVKQIEKFKEFLETNYEKKITNALAKGEKALIVDFSELSSFDPEIGEQLLDEPEETLKAMNIALERFEAPKTFKVRFKNLPESQKLDIRNIRAEHLNKFITIEGIIRQTSDVRPQVISTRFECPSCGNTITIPQLGEQFKEPSRCSCGRKGKFRLLSKDLIDAQRVTIEESPDALKGGAQPKRLHIFLREDLVDPKFERKTTPGSRVLAVGTVNEIPIPLKTGAMSTRFDLAMNANYVDLVEEDFADIEINKEDEEMIKLLSKDPKIYEKLTESIAPSILGHEKVKEALMLQLFGGIRKNKEDGTIARGDFHVLLVGDPGCGKTLHKDSYVILEDGAPRRIGDLVEENMKNPLQYEDSLVAESNIPLKSLNFDGKVGSRNVVRLWKKKENSLFKIKTFCGREIICTSTNPLFTCEDGRVVAKKSFLLKAGDFLACPRKLTVNGTQQDLDFEVQKGKRSKLVEIPKKTSKELWRFISYLLSEGFCYETDCTTTMSFTNKDKALLDDYKSCAETLFKIKLKEELNKNTPYFRINSRYLGNFLKQIGPSLFSSSKNKKIPNLLYKCSEGEIIDFLRVYFDAEGHFTKGKIELVSASKDIIWGIHYLLLRFGILSQIHPAIKYAANTANKTKREYYRLFINSKSALKFINSIGLVSNRKREDFFRGIPSKNNTNIDIIPNLSGILRNVREKLRLNQSNFGIPRPTYQHFERGDRNPSRESLGKIVECINQRMVALSFAQKNLTLYSLRELRSIANLSQEELAIHAGCSQTLISCRELQQHSFNQQLVAAIEKVIGTVFEDQQILTDVISLNLLVQSDIFWDKIVAIEPFTSDDWLYDLEVEETHNFIADSFFVHNSAMLTFISKAAPKARYAAGKGVSSAGLTASVVKDDFLRGWALEAGAMVLANKGVFVLDEMDKISKEDTSALHEAMEQQSYHPETVLTFADGSTAKIGDFVDSLFEKNKDIVINGKDCEILPVNDVELLSTDFNNIKSVYANRVSRHTAPSYFIEVTFSHGRKIIVTPEHPIFIYKNGTFSTVEAEQLKAGAFAPAPKGKLVKGKCIQRVKVKSVRKIPNNGIKWVYDVTVEPNHTFVSEGLVLHNTVTIMKANIHATLKAETSVLSAANPKLGRFDPYGPPIAAQIDLPPALINRFDLIFVMKDIPDRIKDKKIARHVLGIHKTSKNPTSVFPPDLLRKYIAYAKQNIIPQLTDEAIDAMEEFYVSLRNTGTSGERVRPIPISARQIEAMVRLATASAKSRLSNKITVSDAKRAIELVTYSMHEVGIDPETGKLDIDIITTGMSSSTRGRIHSVRDIIFDMDASGRKQIPVEEVVKSALEKGMKEQEIEEAIEKLKRNGDVFEPKKGFLQKI